MRIMNKTFCVEKAVMVIAMTLMALCFVSSSKASAIEEVSNKVLSSVKGGAEYFKGPCTAGSTDYPCVDTNGDAFTFVDCGLWIGDSCGIANFSQPAIDNLAVYLDFPLMFFSRCSTNTVVPSGSIAPCAMYSPTNMVERYVAQSGLGDGTKCAAFDNPGNIPVYIIKHADMCKKPLCSNGSYRVP